MTPSSRPRPRRTLRRAGVGTAAGLALLLGATGCGVGSTSVGPGVAAEVGEETIALTEADAAAADLCDMFTFLAAEGAAQPLPGSLVRQDSLRSLVLREVADQLGEEYGVEPGDNYRAATKDLSSQLAEIGVDDDLVERVVPDLAAVAYYGDVVTGIGQDRLELDAAEDAQGAGLQEGLAVATAWAEDNPIEVNPRFGSIELLDTPQLLSMTGEDLSTPVSDFATAAQGATDIEAAEPGAGADLVADLPASQRCG